MTFFKLLAAAFFAALLSLAVFAEPKITKQPESQYTEKGKKAVFTASASDCSDAFWFEITENSVKPVENGCFSEKKGKELTSSLTFEKVGQDNTEKRYFCLFSSGGKCVLTDEVCVSFFPKLEVSFKTDCLNPQYSVCCILATEHVPNIIESGWYRGDSSHPSEAQAVSGEGFFEYGDFLIISDTDSEKSGTYFRRVVTPAGTAYSPNYRVGVSSDALDEKTVGKAFLSGIRLPVKGELPSIPSSGESMKYTVSSYEWIGLDASGRFSSETTLRITLSAVGDYMFQYDHGNFTAVCGDIELVSSGGDFKSIKVGEMTLECTFRCIIKDDVSILFENGVISTKPSSGCSIKYYGVPDFVTIENGKIESTKTGSFLAVAESGHGYAYKLIEVSGKSTRPRDTSNTKASDTTEAEQTSHIHEYGEYISDESGHRQVCSCGEIANEGTHTGGKATCTERAVCSVCGAAYGKPTRHEMKDGVCSVCGYTEKAAEGSGLPLPDTDKQPVRLDGGEENRKTFVLLAVVAICLLAAIIIIVLSKKRNKG